MIPHLLSSLCAAAFPAPSTVRREAAPDFPAEREPAPQDFSASESPSAPRRVEGRREFHGMLWFPVLTVRDEAKLVVSAKAGLPHCVRCETPLTLESSPREQWRCIHCGETRPGAEADFFVSDSVLAQDLEVFFAANPEYRTAPGLSAPKRALAAEAA